MQPVRLNSLACPEWVVVLRCTMNNTHTHKDLQYCATGKEGTNNATGKHVREFSHLDEQGEARIWLAADGTVYED